MSSHSVLYQCNAAHRTKSGPLSCLLPLQKPKGNKDAKTAETKGGLRRVLFRSLESLPVAPRRRFSGGEPGLLLPKDFLFTFESIAAT